jgi:hypothetical protein
MLTKNNRCSICQDHLPLRASEMTGFQEIPRRSDGGCLIRKTIAREASGSVRIQPLPLLVN